MFLCAYCMKLSTAATFLALAGVAAADPLPLIPQPASLTLGEGAFEFGPDTAIRFDRSLKAEVDLFAADLKALTGTAPKTVVEELRILLPSEIRIDVDAKAEIPAGGYKLEITPKTVVITGKDAAGAYYGTRSILQLLPAANDPAWKDAAPEKLPALTIVDQPRFVWRGMMLDVGRHFYPVEDLKKFIDQLAFHKFNVFHWHLTEDQGWRIEIKKYPKLTQVGSWRDSSPPYGNRNSDDGKRYGGFYTQEQVKDLVAYASARHVTIVPEIEMPGHAAAAITAYPKLGNQDIPGFAPKVITRWGVHPYVFAPSEETFRFIDDVFTEVCALFPSKYIHIGGDEAPKTQWEKSPAVQELMKKENLKDGHDVQSYFVKRVEKILTKKGRKMIGWDEIREGGLSPEATVMSWRGEKGGIDSAKEGHDVVMAANSHLYLDHYQEPQAQALAKGIDKEAIGGFLPISKVYSYNPVPQALSPAEAKHVIGVQAQLWSEYFHEPAKMEYMAFPRIAAVAEIAWTPLERKNYDDFRSRLEGVMKHYDAAGVKHGDPFDTPKKEAKGGAAIETSLGAYDDHSVEFAYDDNADTFFWAGRELKKDDHVTVRLKAPLATEAPVSIATGGKASKNGDKLDKGVLEISEDGGKWTKLADVIDGKAEGTAPAGTRQIRLRVTEPQGNWLIIHEISVGAK